MKENQFLRELIIGEGSAYTENGAVSYLSTGSEFVDQFGTCGTMIGRDIKDVYYDQDALWDENPLYALRFPFYLRMITRKVKIDNARTTKSVMKGQGLRDESFKRMLWLAEKHPHLFESYFTLIPVIGSWKDLWTLMLMDNGKILDKMMIMGYIKKMLTFDGTCNLVKKYLPSIKSEKKCTTDRSKELNRLAKIFANSVLHVTYAEYRKLKSSGTAHDFQKHISKGEYDKIEFGKIPGKALLDLVSSRFLPNHNLVDKYIDWLDGQPLAKYNGHVCELAYKLNHNRNRGGVLYRTVDKQFNNLLENSEEFKENVMVLLDTSGSMNCNASGSKYSCLEVASSLAIYFSALNHGWFKNVVMSFDGKCSIYPFKSGLTFSEKMGKLPYCGWGNTNFMAPIDRICELRRNNPTIPLSDYPKTLLAISDMQFDSCGSASNYQAMIAKLSNVFPADFVNEMKFVWWQVNGKAKDFPANIDKPGNYFFSGYDGNIISILLGNEVELSDPKERPSMDIIIKMALEQEVLQLLEL